MASAAEIRKLTDQEIVGAINDARQEIFNLRLQWVSGQLEDYTRIRQLKKEVARLLTVQRERELAVAYMQEGTDHV
ncbi:MAG TPA: 50S ribosomal protein L29 [Aggregatilineaceae bacterium]|jgi:large subunit ribosomal protein L29|nr:50S ribosomal protein L29 [Aggregatilineaceae bacterium]